MFFNFAFDFSTVFYLFVWVKLTCRTPIKHLCLRELITGGGINRGDCSGVSTDLRVLAGLKHLGDLYDESCPNVVTNELHSAELRSTETETVND